MAQQVAVTIVAPVRPDRLDDLRRLLDHMGDDVAGNDVVPFGRLSGVHFARLVVLDPTTDVAGRAIAPKLVYMSDVDGLLARHVEDLVDVAGDGIDELFGHCVGYPEAGATRRQRLACLYAWMAPAAAVYVNTIGRSVAKIERDNRLRDEIERYLDRLDLAGSSPAEVRAELLTFVGREPDLAWALQPDAEPPLAWRARETLHFAGGVAVALALLPVALVAAPAYALVLRRLEQADRPDEARPDSSAPREAEVNEDLWVHNPFSAVGFVKPGWFRRATATVVLGAVNFGTRHLFNRGSLTGGKTIHFARWVFLDGKRRIIFVSNYDGSLESYMGDFIDKVAWGLNAVFSNGIGYPRTSWLVAGGARDEESFKAFLRSHQLTTKVWFSAYPQLTTANIENNAAIRAGLLGVKDDAEVEQWLARL
jgi:hypothetical protein